jgi:hypothetical protein
LRLYQWMKLFLFIFRHPRLVPDTIDYQHGLSFNTVFVLKICHKTFKHFYPALLTNAAFSALSLLLGFKSKIGGF